MRHKNVPGFTLIEMIVSVALFAAVMLIAVTTLMSMVNADRKAQSLQAVIDNLDFALDDMSREVRTGTTYHCGSGVSPFSETAASLSQPRDCANAGSSYIAVEGSVGKASNVYDQVVYWIAPKATCGTGFVGNCIEKSTDGGQTFLPITSPNIAADSMVFYVTGSSKPPADMLQPRIVIVLSAHITLPNGSVTPLHLQTTLTQRVYDQ